LHFGPVHCCARAELDAITSIAIEPARPISATAKIVHRIDFIPDDPSRNPAITSLNDNRLLGAMKTKSLACPARARMARRAAHVAVGVLRFRQIESRQSNRFSPRGSFRSVFRPLRNRQVTEMFEALARKYIKASESLVARQIGGRAGVRCGAEESNLRCDHSLVIRRRQVCCSSRSDGLYQPIGWGSHTASWYPAAPWFARVR
jgi:hypothetical protein